MNPGGNAVVLSGGGANGAYEVGILKALLGGTSPVTGCQPLHPGIITGTSIGAFNSAVLVSQLRHGSRDAVAYLEDVWLNIIPRDDSTDHNHIFRFRGDPFEFFNPGLLAREPLVPLASLLEDSAYFARDWLNRATFLLQSESRAEQRFLEAIDLSTFLTNEPAMRLVRRTVNAQAIRESGTILKIAATNWETGELKIFRNADMTDDFADKAILSSTAIPGLFPPVIVNGDPYVDAGVVMNTPLVPAIDAGADTFYLVYLDPDVGKIPVKALQSTLDTIGRLFTIQFASKMNEDIATAAWVNRGLTTMERAAKGAVVTDDQARAFMKVAGEIAAHLSPRHPDKKPYRRVTIHRFHPHDDLGGGLLGWLNFDRNRIQRLIERGYQDASAHDCDQSECVMADGTRGYPKGLRNSHAPT